MMPVLFRVLLTRFIGLFFLSSGALLGLLLSTRFYEIAKFAALGGLGWPLIAYTFCQIPFILPIVIPVGAALASFFLCQELSRSGMVTSLRASSLSFRTLLTPLLLLAFFLSLLNGVIVSEISPAAKAKTKALQKEWTGINPLALLKQKELLLSAGMEIVPLGDADPSSFAEHVIAAVRQPGKDRLLLMTAERLDRSGSSLDGRDVSTFIYDEQKGDLFADLYLDKSLALTTNIEPLTFILTKERGRPAPDHLTTYQWASEIKKTPDSIFPLVKLISEGFRRLMIALSPLTFTLLGAASGLMIGRRASIRPQITLLFLTALFLTAFFFGKSFDKDPMLAVPFFLLPHVLLTTVAIRRLYCLGRGIE